MPTMRIIGLAWAIIISVMIWLGIGWTAEIIATHKASRHVTEAGQ